MPVILCDVLSPSVDAISVFTNTGVSRSCRDVVNPMSRGEDKEGEGRYSKLSRSD